MEPWEPWESLVEEADCDDCDETISLRLWSDWLAEYTTPVPMTISSKAQNYNTYTSGLNPNECSPIDNVYNT